MTEGPTPGSDDLEAYRETCRVDAEALLACVVFALHRPPPGPDGSAFAEDPDGLDARLSAFIDFDDGERLADRWKL